MHCLEFINNLSDISWNKLVKFLHIPCDPSLLAYMRIAFGILMMLDIPQERGMTTVHDKFGEASIDHCRFPLFNNLQPLSADGMMILYTVLFFASLLITLGLFYRIACILFVCIYWYIFFLDKTVWNNHSYLYGLLGFIMLVTDGNHYCSIDGLICKNINNTSVPLWNYVLLRFQIFIVYFYAGLKKTDQDWLLGYSMTKLSQKWVFSPLRIILNDSFIDHFIVHIGGFLLDSSAGFLLLFDRTRKVGFVFVGAFNLMNSTMFSIGMFPWAMLATLFVFCSFDSFKQVMKKIPCQICDTSPMKNNQKCKYKSYNKQKYSTIFVILYIIQQCFLPYSHFITKG